MTWLDIIILLPLLLGLILGIKRGLISELIAISAVVLGFVGARLLGSPCSQWLSQQFTWTEAISNIVAYVVIFVVTALALTLIGKALTKVAKEVHLGLLNRLAGGLFGLAKWGIIVLIITFCIYSVDTRWHILNDELKSTSIVYSNAVELTQYLLSITPYEDLSLPRV